VNKVFENFKKEYGRTKKLKEEAEKLNWDEDCAWYDGYLCTLENFTRLLEE